MPEDLFATLEGALEHQGSQIPRNGGGGFTGLGGRLHKQIPRIGDGGGGVLGPRV